MKNCQIITTCELQWRQRLVGQCGQGGKVNALLDNEWIFKLKMVENNLLLGLESWHFSSGFMRWDIAGPLKYSWLSSAQNKADQPDNQNPIKVYNTFCINVGDLFMFYKIFIWCTFTDFDLKFPQHKALNMTCY